MEQPVARTPRPSMFTADEVVERLKIKRGGVYEVIRQVNKEQEALGRVVIREHTWLAKENIIQSKLIPFFGDMRMCDIRPVDIVRWQNSLTGSTRPDGDVFKPTYLRIINSQINAIFNHAERYYNLEKNPVHKVDKMGSKEAGEVWSTCARKARRPSRVHDA